MVEKVAGRNREDPFITLRRQQLVVVLDRQTRFLLANQIPGTDLFRKVRIGEEEVKKRGGKAFMRTIYMDGEFLQKGFRRIIKSIQADLGER